MDYGPPHPYLKETQQIFVEKHLFKHEDEAKTHCWQTKSIKR